MRRVEPTPDEHARFASDCADYKLAWRCTDCVHYNEGTARCSLEYPISELMRAESYDTPRATYVFCKHFELI